MSLEEGVDGIGTRQEEEVGEGVQVIDVCLKIFRKTQFDVFDIYSIGFETVGLKFMRFLLHFINLLDILKKKKYL